MVDIVPLPTTPAPADVTFTPVSFATDMTGPLGGPTQRVLRGGDRFRLELGWGPLAYDDARVFLARLMRAAASPLAVEFPQRGLKPASPGALVVATGSTPNTLAVSGGTPGFPLKEGQFFHLASGGRRWIHQLQQDVTLDGSGAAALPINPLLRVAPAVGDATEWVHPILEGFVDQGWTWNLQMMVRVGLKFSITEDR